MNYIELGTGALAALIVVGPFLKLDRMKLIRLSSFGLLIAAIIYVLFAVYGLITSTADGSWLLFELGGVLAFGSLAFLGIRKNGFYAGIGWALHGFWDYGFHIDKDFVPWFYPGVCLGFDVLLALFTFYWSMSDNRE